MDQNILFPRSHQCLGVWEQITNDPEVLEIIKGYLIKFQQTPFQMGPPLPLRNFLEGEMAAVDKDTVDLLKKGAIEVCSHTPGEFVSNIFMVPKKSGGNRPVIDTRAPNEFVEYIPFRMEDISLLKSVLKQGDFMTKLNLRGTYLTVPVHKRSRIYLRFFWRGVLYQFTCLSFGLSTSGRIFTEAMKPVIAFLRAMGIRLLSFLDNILIMASSHKLAMHATHRLGNPGLNLLGICDKLPKVYSHPFKGVAILGLRSKLRSNETFLAKRIAFKSKMVCCRDHVPSSHCKPCSKFSQSLSVDNACDSRNPPSHPGNTERSHKGRSSPCFLQNQGHPFSGGNKRPAVVDRFSPLKQWKRHNSPSYRHNDFLRFVKNRLGCPPFNPDRGKMVKKRGQFPHKLSGTKSSIPSFSGSCSISQGAPHLFWHRQPHMSHINKLGALGLKNCQI